MAIKNQGIVQRKNDHLDIILNTPQDVTGASTGFGNWRFVHCALPEIDYDAIDLRSVFLNKTLSAPLLISSMTGGAQRSKFINHHLAEAAQELNVAMGVGSQRIALEGQSDCGIDKSLRRLAPDIPLMANLGAAQLAGEKGIDSARRVVDMIEADALIIHLNPLQEILQSDGDRDWAGKLDAIAQVVRHLTVPVVVKEVGAGISAAVAGRLIDAGVTAIDVAGEGGTSWAAVEGKRAESAHLRALASAFADWGIPTAQALQAIASAYPNTPVIASGGIRTGIDAAKALRLGACLVGQAAAILDSATESTQAVVDRFAITIEQLKLACFCTGSINLDALKTADIIQSGGGS